MMTFLRNLWLPKPSDWQPPRPVDPICVIGDVHGMAGLLEQMLNLIATQPEAGRVRRIFVGDLIDRGPDSASVLERVRTLCTDSPLRNICLMGNHEQMMLEFIADPVARRAHWLTHGGDATLASFGLRGKGRGLEAAEHLMAQAAALRQALPEGMENWLAELPLIWREGSLAVTHAGADPAHRLTDQNPAALVWGHRNFRRKARTDAVWLAHGHVIVPDPSAQDGRIAVDTGAYRTGRLSAAWIDREGVRFLEVNPA